VKVTRFYLARACEACTTSSMSLAIASDRQRATCTDSCAFTRFGQPRCLDPRRSIKMKLAFLAFIRHREQPRETFFCPRDAKAMLNERPGLVWSGIGTCISAQIPLAVNGGGGGAGGSRGARCPHVQPRG